MPNLDLPETVSMSDEAEVERMQASGVRTLNSDDVRSYSLEDLGMHVDFDEYKLP